MTKNTNTITREAHRLFTELTAAQNAAAECQAACDALEALAVTGNFRAQVMLEQALRDVAEFEGEVDHVMESIFMAGYGYEEYEQWLAR